METAIKPIKSAGRPTYRAETNFKVGEQLGRILFEMIAVRPGFNVRTIFDEIELNELADNIDVNGLQDPIRGDLFDGKFWITDGERRFRAIQILINRSEEHKERFEYVAVRPNSGDTKETDRIIYMLSSGVNKAPYLPIEIAKGVLRLKEELKNEGKENTNAEIGKLMSKSRQWVDGMIRLASAPAEVQKQVEAGEKAATNAVAETRRKKEVKQEEETPFRQTSILDHLQPDEDDDDEEDNELEAAEAELTTALFAFQDTLVLPEKTDLKTEMTSGIAPKGTAPTTKDRQINSGGGSDMMGAVDLDEVSEPELLLKNMRNNIAKIDALCNGLNPQARADADLRISYLLKDISELESSFSSKKNRF